jgi:hypothetical protein
VVCLTSACWRAVIDSPLQKGFRAAQEFCGPNFLADPALDLSASRPVEAMHHLLATDGF